MITDPYTLYESYEVNPTTGTTGYKLIITTATSTETFANTTKAIMIAAKLNPIYIEISTNGISYGGKIQIDASTLGGQSFTTSYKCKAVRVSNVDTGGSANGSYQAIGLR